MENTAFCSQHFQVRKNILRLVFHYLRRSTFRGSSGSQQNLSSSPFRAYLFFEVCFSTFVTADIAQHKCHTTTYMPHDMKYQHHETKQVPEPHNTLATQNNKTHLPHKTTQHTYQTKQHNTLTTRNNTTHLPHKKTQRICHIKQHNVSVIQNNIAHLTDKTTQRSCHTTQHSYCSHTTYLPQPHNKSVTATQQTYHSHTTNVSQSHNKLTTAIEQICHSHTTNLSQSHNKPTTATQQTCHSHTTQRT